MIMMTNVKCLIVNDHQFDGVVVVWMMMIIIKMNGNSMFLSLTLINPIVHHRQDQVLVVVNLMVVLAGDG